MDSRSDYPTKAPAPLQHLVTDDGHGDYVSELADNGFDSMDVIATLIDVDPEEIRVCKLESSGC